ncbi:diiron oxygenase [Streptomyces sp. NPDC049879]|uniref:diiron oxygenase n=1 Tax=Streptomyces sp. NPDC049879 TaxID=3365598 RepID=UPI00378DE041
MAVAPRPAPVPDGPAEETFNDFSDDDIAALRDSLGSLRSRERVAERLLASSARHSFDPDTELDWDAPWTEGLWYWPPELVSLYDTPLWYAMPEEQRIDLSRHESAALASLGTWFELILMQLLVRHIYDKPQTSAHVRYALTEIADECRHSMMFMRAVRKAGTPAYPPGRLHHNLARVFKTASTTPGSFTATLLGEEVLDWMQRLTFPDERVQPLIRGVTRIHVVEEARHVRYAREELRRQMRVAPRWERELTRITAGEFARIFSVAFVNPRVYTAVGLDRAEAVAQVRAGAHRREVMRQGARRLTDFLDEIGVLSGVGRALWRRSGLLA